MGQVKMMIDDQMKKKEKEMEEDELIIFIIHKMMMPKGPGRGRRGKAIPTKGELGKITNIRKLETKNYNT
jgi:hypothetical protein